MANSLKSNAYHVLGLDTSATSKKILQRANEIVRRLKIDDFPAYDLDIITFKNFRTEDTVKDALRRLQSPKLRIQEYFFWFGCADSIDEQALSHFATQDYPGAIGVWEKGASGDNDVSFRFARYAALTRCLGLLTGGEGDQLEASLQAWKRLLESDAFWSSFSRTYKFDDAYTASDDVFADFRASALGYVSDIYVELQDARKGSDCVYRFQKLFSGTGEKVEKDILNPAFQAIQNAISALDAIDTGEGVKFDAGAAERVRKGVEAIQSELNKLVDLGLFSDSATKVIRDHAANSIRRIVLDLHNHHDEMEKSHKLLAVAAQIAGTDSLKSVLAGELEQIQKNITHDAENTLALDIPGTFGGGRVVFKNNYLTYDDRKIFYKDATSISYHSVSRSVNLIPVSQSYSYMVSTKNETISFSFGTTLYIGNDKKRDVWARLAGVSQKLIEPYIVEKLVRRIFENGETVQIGSLEFSREGYFRSKMFGGREGVAWSDTIYIPKLNAGNVIVWKDKSGKGVQFTAVPMSTPNAVVMPELVQACHNAVQSHGKR